MQFLKSYMLMCSIFKSKSMHTETAMELMFSHVRPTLETRIPILPRLILGLNLSEASLFRTNGHIKFLG